MLMFFLNILDRYGLGILNLVVMVFFGVKIMTNHLKHLKDSVDEIFKKVSSQEEKLNCLGERVAKIEGKIE